MTLSTVPFPVVLIITIQEKAGYCYLHSSTSTAFDKILKFKFFKKKISPFRYEKTTVQQQRFKLRKYLS